MNQPFTFEQLQAIRAFADEAARRTGDANYFRHCLTQCQRFGLNYRYLTPKRLVQFGLNFGRAQEIAQACGGMTCWWKWIEPLLDAEDGDAMAEGARWLIEQLGYAPATDAELKL